MQKNSSGTEHQQPEVRFDGGAPSLPELRDKMLAAAAKDDRQAFQEALEMYKRMYGAAGSVPPPGRVGK